MKPKHTPGLTITNNTDSVDIDQKCIGLSVGLGAVSPLNANRGLHIQIRHNRDKATFEKANEVARLIAAAPEMLEALTLLLNAVRSGIDADPKLWRDAVNASDTAIAKATGGAL